MHTMTQLGMLNSFVKMKRFGSRIFFGFSTFANMRSHKTPDVIRAVPDDKLLLESDLENPHGVADACSSMLRTIADAKGWDMETAARITRENAQQFYTARKP